MALETKLGSCLCGDVKFSAVPHASEMRACHCTMCRQWTAGPFMTMGCEEVVFESETRLSIFKSSAWGERGFCKTCGTSLFWRTHDNSGYGVSISALEDTDDVPLTLEFFIDEKPRNYEFSSESTKLTGLEVFAMFAPAEEGHN